MPALTHGCAMTCSGVAARTQQSYLAAVEGLTRHYGRGIDGLTTLTDEELRQ